MKIVLIHGDNKQKVQERVRTIVDGVRKKGWKIERLDKKASLADAYVSNTLLPEEKLCIFEGVNNLNKENVEWLKNNADKTDGSLLIVHNGDAPKAPLKPISKIITEEHFSYPQLLFKYLETLNPKNISSAIKMLHSLLETESIELVTAMMGRHLRDLYWIKTAPETIDYPEWRKKKLHSQANVFSLSTLENMISDLAKADYEAKSGGLNLQVSIDLLLMRQLSQ